MINGSAVKILGSSFVRGNNSALNGSALEILSTGSYLNIRDCNFTSNTGYYGGAIYISSSGTNDSPAQISNCTFKSNSAYQRGGAIYIGGTTCININDCTFNDNFVRFFSLK